MLGAYAIVISANAGVNILGDRDVGSSRRFSSASWVRSSNAVSSAFETDVSWIWMLAALG